MNEVLRARLRRQRHTALGPGLAIAIAVAFVLATVGAITTMSRYVADSAAPRASVADVVVSATDGSGEPLAPDVVARVAGRSDVAAVDTETTAGVSVSWPWGERSESVSTTAADPGLAWYRIVEGAAPSRDGDVLVDSGWARRHGIAVGRRLEGTRSDGQGGQASFEMRVSGTYRAANPIVGANLLAGRDDVRAWTGGGPSSPWPADEAYVDAVPGTDARTLAAALAAALPGSTVRTGSEVAAEAADAALGGVVLLGTLLAGFTAIALGVCAIVIANTFTILLAQRMQETALLRCVGARRGQVTRATMAEAAVLGAIAGAIGTGAGLVVVYAGTAVLARAAGLTGLRPGVAPWVVLAAIALGVAVTILSAVGPVTRASRVAPMVAMRPDAAPVARHKALVSMWAGTGLGALGTATVAAGMTTGGAAGVLAGVGGGLLVVVGFAVASPAVVPAIIRVVAGGMSRLGPVTGIAAANTLRHPRRTAATTTALFIGVCLMTVMAVGAATVQSAARADLLDNNPVDLRVEASGAGADAVTLPESVVARLTAADGPLGDAIDSSAVIRRADVTVEGLDPAGPVGTEVLGGSPDDLARVYRWPLDVPEGSIAVPAYSGVTAGAPLTLRSGDASVTVTAMPADTLGMLLVSEDVMDRLGAPAGVSQVWIRVHDDADLTAVEAAVQDLLAGTGDRVLVTGSVLDGAAIARILQGMLTVAAVLVGISVLVSLVGIGTTLALSVLERRRETAVSRAVGMTRRQVRAGLAVEAALVSAVGSGCGVVVGSLLGWAGAVALLRGEYDVTHPVVPIGQVGVVVVAAVAAALLASVLPGRRLARVSPAAALAMS